MTGSRRLILVLACCSLLAAANNVAMAQQPPRSPSTLKVVWLYNLGVHTKWPENAVPNANNTFVIGVLGPNPFGSLLNGLAGQKIAKQTVVIRNFATSQNVTPCHILFISPVVSNVVGEQTSAQRLAAIRQLGAGNALLVTDEQDITKAGSMINFEINNQKVNLEINMPEVRRARLVISPAVLALDIVKFTNGK